MDTIEYYSTGTEVFFIGNDFKVRKGTIEYIDISIISGNIANINYKIELQTPSTVTFTRHHTSVATTELDLFNKISHYAK